MTEISRSALFGKLNPLAYKAIEGATLFCKMRGNPYVELVHWLHQILQNQDTDLHRIMQRFDLDAARLAKDLTDALERLPRGSRSIADLSSDVEEAVERGWVYGTLMFGETQVRTGHLMVGILKTRGLRSVLLAISRQFDKIGVERLSEEFAELLDASPEAGMTANDGFRMDAGAASGDTADAIAPAQMGKQDALKQFSIDLTERARNGELDPIVGRDQEIRQIVDILMRRRQNNPILTGEAGVGKTAVVEGFALRIAAGEVPPPLADVTLRVLDIGLLQAGASMKGEFEHRLRQVIDEVQTSPEPIILFIDEAHTLIGAGGTAGTGDAANLLKPALARGPLRPLAATTWSEYKKYIEKAPALTRRFQVIQIHEPSEDKAILMLRGIASTLEQHHRVQLLDEALESAVRLSHRYIPARQLPDKAVSLLDTACARVAISQTTVPGEIEDCRRRIQAVQTELDIIANETAVGVGTHERETSAREQLATQQQRLAELESRWDEERRLVEAILSLRARLRGQTAPVEGTGSALEATAQTQIHATPALAPKPAPEIQTEPSADLETAATPVLSDNERAQALQQLRELQTELHALQGEHPFILPSVDAQAVASVVADWTGIPVGRMVKNEVQAVLDLAETLNKRVIGQRHALDRIARRIQTSRARLDNPDKPIGVFLLAGPSGVGKTETGLALAEALYGGEQNIITINMSEFQEAHSVATLKGSPPGYIGYGEGGLLTEAVRRKPYSVVLLDEVEKAHPDVHEIFFQVFDKGWMEDAEGRRIDFRNTLILLTSNVGTDLIMGLCQDPDLMPEPEGIATALREPLLKTFPAALLGRLVTIPYYPLDDQMLAAIIRLQLKRIVQRIHDNHQIPLTFSDQVVTLIAARCAEVESGARVVDAILTNTVLPEISRELLICTMEGRTVAGIRIDVGEDGFVFDFDPQVNPPG